MISLSLFFSPSLSVLLDDTFPPSSAGRVSSRSGTEWMPSFSMIGAAA